MYYGGEKVKPAVLGVASRLTAPLILPALRLQAQSFESPIGYEPVAMPFQQNQREYLGEFSCCALLFSNAIITLNYPILSPELSPMVNQIDLATVRRDWTKNTLRIVATDNTTYQT